MVIYDGDEALVRFWREFLEKKSFEKDDFDLVNIDAPEAAVILAEIGTDIRRKNPPKQQIRSGRIVLYSVRGLRNANGMEVIDLASASVEEIEGVIREK